MYELVNQTITGDHKIIVSKNIHAYVIKNCVVHGVLSIENEDESASTYTFENLICNKLILRNIKLTNVHFSHCNIIELELKVSEYESDKEYEKLSISKLILETENNLKRLPALDCKSLEINYLGNENQAISIVDKTLDEVTIKTANKISIHLEIIRSSIKEFSIENAEISAFYITHSSKIQLFTFEAVRFLVPHFELKNENTKELKFKDCRFNNFTIHAQSIDYLFIENCIINTINLKVAKLEYLYLSENQGDKIKIANIEISKLAIQNTNNINIDAINLKINDILLADLINFKQINILSSENTRFNSIKIIGSELRDTRFLNIDFNDSTDFELAKSNILDVQFSNCVLPSAINTNHNAFSRTKYDEFPQNMQETNSLIYSFSDTKEAYRQLKIISEKQKNTNNELHYKSHEYQITSLELSERLSLPLKKLEYKNFIKKLPKNFKNKAKLLIPTIKRNFFIFIEFLKHFYQIARAKIKIYLPIIKATLIKILIFLKKIFLQIFIYTKKIFFYLNLFIHNQFLKIKPILSKINSSVKLFFKKENLKHFVSNLIPNFISTFRQIYIRFAELLVKNLHYRSVNNAFTVAWALSIVKIVGKSIIFIFKLVVFVLLNIISFFTSLFKNIYSKIKLRNYNYSQLSEKFNTQNTKNWITNISHSPIYTKIKNIASYLLVNIIKFYYYLSKIAKIITNFIIKNKNFFLYIKLVVIILPEIIILKLNQLSTSHGKYWFQGVVFTLVTLTISFYAYCRITFGAENTIFGLSNFLYYLESFPILKLSEIENLYKINDNGFIVLTSRIIAIYGVYQIIAAFRKYRK